MFVTFKDYDDAFKALPDFIGGHDPLQHTTISELAYLVEHEINLYTEGEPNEIKSSKRGVTTRRYKQCKNFIERCRA